MCLRPESEWDTVNTGLAEGSSFRLPRSLPSSTKERVQTAGQPWQVPRQFARRHFQGISSFNVAEMSRRPAIRGRPGDAVDWTELDTEVQVSICMELKSYEAIKEIDHS